MRDFFSSNVTDDDVTPQDRNTGIMRALLEVGGVQGVFVGHDHGICIYTTIKKLYPFGIAN